MVGTAGGKSNVLVDGNGCALYINAQDTTSSTACDTTCEQTWRPVVAPVQAGSGVTAANLGSWQRPSGTNQATYFGHQLYRFTGDTAPGQANGQGQNQTWWLIGADGEPVQN
jgi:predicted lipoprotein with Yx(FWY)xxD motif